jgi:hypothetical protein
MTNIKTLIAATCLLGTFDLNTNEWKQRILRQWNDSKNLPRKKKKVLRRSLRIDWVFANYNPFENI